MWEANTNTSLWKIDLEIWTGLEWLRKKSSKTCVRMAPWDAQTARNFLRSCVSLSFLLEVSSGDDLNTKRSTVVPKIEAFQERHKFDFKLCIETKVMFSLLWKLVFRLRIITFHRRRTLWELMFFILTVLSCVHDSAWKTTASSRFEQKRLMLLYSILPNGYTADYRLLWSAPQPIILTLR
jgi:hypothetical protein